MNNNYDKIDDLVIKVQKNNNKIRLNIYESIEVIKKITEEILTNPIYFDLISKNDKNKLKNFLITIKYNIDQLIEDLNKKLL